MVSLDPCGIVCVLVTYGVVLYSDYVIVRQVIQPVLKNSFWAVANSVGFNIVVFLLTFSHLCAVFTDPGTVPNLRPYDPKQPHQCPNGWSVCTRCSIYRPPRAHHCRVCQRCIRRMDHHCPWINNCVGEFNQKYFILFLIYVGILCMYALLLVIVCRAMISDEPSLHRRSPSDAIVVAHTVVLVAICCLFGLFVLAILSDQYKSIVEDETAVELVQKYSRSGNRNSTAHFDPEAGHFPRRLSKRDLFSEVFGSGSVFMWLLPCHHLLRGQNHHENYSFTQNNRVPAVPPLPVEYQVHVDSNQASPASTTSTSSSSSVAALVPDSRVVDSRHSVITFSGLIPT